MAEPTRTRAQLRQAVLKPLGMRFFDRASSGTIDSVSGNYAVDAGLLSQADGFWRRSWFFVPARDEQRLILGNERAKTNVLFETPASPIAASDVYEILDVWSPTRVHEAINQALREAWPAFFEIPDDKTLVLVSERLEYGLTSLAKPPWLIAKVFLEAMGTSIRDTVAAAAATSVTLASADIASVTSDWLISIYKGTGAGQLRSVVTTVPASKQVNVAAWTTQPDTTSLACLWNPNVQQYPWRRVLAIDFDRMEFPSSMRFLQRYEAYAGGRIRIQYAAKPVDLSAEADTTFVPDAYLVPRAQSILLAEIQRDNRFDRSRFSQDAGDLLQQAEFFKGAQAFQMPALSLWQEEEEFEVGSVSLSATGENPLDW